MNDHVVFADPVPGPELENGFIDRGWDRDLLVRALRLRLPRSELDGWLAMAFLTAEMLDGYLAQREMLAEGTMRVRGANWEDSDRIADLFAHSTERVGPWEIIVERSPNAFAQFRLQENPTLQVLEDRGVLLACFATAGRNTLIDGRELSVNLMSAWRVRDGFKKMGFSNLIRQHPGHAFNHFGLVSYWYVRLENADALGFVDTLREQFADRPDEWKIEFQGLTATVHHLPVAGARAHEQVRPTTPADIGRCVELVNRTHEGLDLFRPYTDAWLRQRLDDGPWGPRPSFVPRVYGWEDHCVLVDSASGEVVACAGLWDRGRDMRERWRHCETGEERLVETCCVLDFGYAAGHEADMVGLIDHLRAETALSGRSALTVPLEFLPAVADRLAERPVPETRRMEAMPFNEPGLKVDVTITRPYTDLAYW